MSSLLSNFALVVVLTLVACAPEVTPTGPDAGSPTGSPGTSTCTEFCDEPGADDPPPDQPPPDQPPLPPDTVEVPLFFIGDCVTATCPTATPYPVGCEVLFSPGDDRGCVASTPTSSVVYFQAGDQCDQGLVGGRLLCSATPGAALGAATCTINKPVPIYASSPAGCPPVH